VTEVFVGQGRQGTPHTFGKPQLLSTIIFHRYTGYICTYELYFAAWAG